MQTELPLGPEVNHARKRERLDIYEAILALRRRGFRVKRAGANHMVAGKHFPPRRLSARQVLKLAAL